MLWLPALFCRTKRDTLQFVLIARIEPIFMINGPEIAIVILSQVLQAEPCCVGWDVTEQWMSEFPDQLRSEQVFRIRLNVRVCAN